LSDKLDVPIEALIAGSPLFANLDEAGRQRLVEGGTLESFDSGTIIVKEGDPGDSFYFIKGGSVEVYTEKAGERLSLAQLGEGEFFGEVSVLTAQPRTATVIAKEPTQALRFVRRKISRVLMEYPEVTKVLNATIGERADDTIKKILG
jgi:cAMP-dependent protein kinase regulator